MSSNTQVQNLIQSYTKGWNSPGNRTGKGKSRTVGEVCHQSSAATTTAIGYEKARCKDSNKLSSSSSTAVLYKSKKLLRKEQAQKLFEEVQHSNCVGRNLVLELNLKYQIQEDPDILWVPVSCGMTCMHIVAQCWTHHQYVLNDEPDSLRFLTTAAAPTIVTAILQQYHGSHQDSHDSSRSTSAERNKRGPISTNVWAWIVTQASMTESNRGKFARHRDAGGDTILDAFWTAWVEPSRVPLFGNTARTPSVPTHVRKFADALDTVLADKSLLTQVRDFVEIHNHRKSDATSFCTDESVPDSVYLVVRFWIAFSTMLEAAKEENQSTLSYLVSTGSCPERLARLAIGILPQEVKQSMDPESGRTLLHGWALAPKSVHQDRDGMLDPLLVANAGAAMVADHPDGRLPLHCALHSGKPLHQITRLWRCVPASLHVPDPIKGLGVVPLMVLAARKEKLHTLTALDRRNPSVSLHDWLDARRDTDQVRQALNVKLVDTIYNVLRAYPQVLVGATAGDS